MLHHKAIFFWEDLLQLRTPISLIAVLHSQYSGELTAMEIAFESATEAQMPQHRVIDEEQLDNPGGANFCQRLNTPLTAPPDG